MNQEKQNVKFDDSIEKSLLDHINHAEPRAPTKVTVVGCGMVGMACSISVLLKNLVTNLVLMDVNEEKLKGEILDLNHGSLFLSGINIEGGGDYRLSQNSKLVILTAGARQKVGESRLNLVQRNVDIFKHIIPNLVKFSPEAIMLVVSNPVDIMTYVTWKLSGFPRSRIIGSGTSLDSARFRHLIANALNISSTSVHGIIIGEHGDSSIPLWNDVSVSGKRLASIDPKIGQKDGPKGWDSIHQQVVQGAYEVIKLKGYTNWAIGFSCAEIVKAILFNMSAIHPVSCFVKGHLGIEHDVCLSLPCVLDAAGVSSLVQVELNDAEKAAINRSAGLIHKIQHELHW